MGEKIQEDTTTATTPLKIEEVSPKNQARGAAWAGGISGLFIGGPIGAALFGWLGWRFASKDAGSFGDFCRKAGDFANRLGDSIHDEWDKSKPLANEEKPSGTDRTSFQQAADYFQVDSSVTDKVSYTYAHTSNFTNRVYDSIKGEWNKAAESCNDEKEASDSGKTPLISIEKGGVIHKSSTFLGRISDSIREKWNESKSTPLTSTTPEEELTN